MNVHQDSPDPGDQLTKMGTDNEEVSTSPTEGEEVTGSYNRREPDRRGTVSVRVVGRHVG